MVGGGTGWENVHTSRARIVFSSSPTRRSGSTRNLAPSSSPTASSPCDCGWWIGGGALKSLFARAEALVEKREVEAGEATAARVARRKRADRMDAATADMFIVGVYVVWD